MDVTFNEDLAYFSTDGSPLQGEMDGIFEENSHDNMLIDTTFLTSDQRHDTLDTKNCLKEGNSSTTCPNIVDSTTDGSPLYPKHIQSTPEATNEVLSEPDETFGETSNFLTLHLNLTLNSNLNHQSINY